ncbi:MAG TPA: S8 family serine peptidase, partial [Fimbriimonas sp.]|nr:S8 family serine peptidase [Fimbriimonas sp.]
FSDFNTFSGQFSLPKETSADPTASTNRVFQIVYAAGVAPAADPGWGQEMALDTQWAHATAPGAKVYLVESASDDFNDLIAAVKVARSLPNVREVSMSFGGTEIPCFFAEWDSVFVKSGVAFFAASGDVAAAKDFPAESKNVVCVGGTKLQLNIDGSWAGETAWDSGGCGASNDEPRPTFQDGVYPLVGKYRGAVDIAAIADVNPGVAVYDTFPDHGQSGWLIIGGTSASCAIMAGIVNSSGVSFASSKDLNSKLYALMGTSALHDVSAGSTGSFSAAAGWDFPTGAGSPNGLGAALAAAVGRVARR